MHRSNLSPVRRSHRAATLAHALARRSSRAAGAHPTALSAPTRKTLAALAAISLSFAAASSAGAHLG